MQLQKRQQGCKRPICSFTLLPFIDVMRLRREHEQQVHGDSFPYGAVSLLLNGDSIEISEL